LTGWRFVVVTISTIRAVPPVGVSEKGGPMAEWNTLDVRIDGPVGWVRFNRPEARNSVTSEMADEMYLALRRLSMDDSLSVVVLTGAGSTFCPGADISTDRSRDTTRDPLPLVESYHSARLLFEMPKLTLAGVNGGCAGAGFAWAAACDLRVASSAARFATAFQHLDLSGELGISAILQMQLGAARARELLFLPRKFDAAHAAAIGFVSEVFPAESFDTDLGALVEELAGRDPESVQTMKRNLVDALHLSLPELTDVEAARHRARFTGDAAAITYRRLADQGRLITTAKGKK
jgi:2-(1,2-epoxy-1,2-dihydrophenyl)acetyl-CoA isomerase